MTKEEINNLVLNNERLAYLIANRYKNKFSRLVEFEDLKGTCLLGLVKAANTFDTERNIQFSTYAYRVIVNEIIVTYSKSIKYANTIHLEDNINDNLTYLDTLEDELDLELEVVKHNQLEKLQIYLNDLPEKHLAVMKLSLQEYNQCEIGRQLNISQSQVSLLYNEALNILRRKFNL